MSVSLYLCALLILSLLLSHSQLTLPLHAAVFLPAIFLWTLPLSKSPVLVVWMERTSVFPLMLPALTLPIQGLLVCESKTASYSLFISPSPACQLMGSTAFVWWRRPVKVATKWNPTPSLSRYSQPQSNFTCSHSASSSPSRLAPLITFHFGPCLMLPIWRCSLALLLSLLLVRTCCHLYCKITQNNGFSFSDASFQTDTKWSQFSIELKGQSAGRTSVSAHILQSPHIA